jgi:Ion channel
MRKWAPVIVLYIIAIFGFAGLYSCSPQDFYHPYVKFEPAVRDLRSKFKKELGEAINTQLGSSPNLGDGMKFESAFAIDIFGERNGVLLGSVHMFATLANDQGQQAFLSRLPILVGPHGLRTFEKKPGLVGYLPGEKAPPGFKTGGELGTVYVARDSERPSDDLTMLPHNSDSERLVSQAAGKALDRVQLTSEQQTEALEIVRAEEGFPASVAGTFYRMLYFSAITITTVGYGDIVPLTGFARTLAAIEATIGIVLLGLFVSRLVR